MSGMLALLVLVALLLAADAAFSVYLALYTWSDPGRFAGSQAPARRSPPRRSFTLLVPARDEAGVIAETLRGMAALRYPRALFEIIVICEAGDELTIAAVRGAIRDLGADLVRLVTFSGPPITKPRGLNAGLRAARGEVVGVFDAEDSPDPDVLDVVNSVMEQEGVRVAQLGVQLMNIGSRWYSALNALEYFFWFRSRLHFFAHRGVVPLGGNTVFFTREVLRACGGWQDRYLTEDAEIGLDLSARGERVRVVYDGARVTREESPPTVAALVRQRTRWSQGFLQIVAAGHWRRLDAGRAALALYTMLSPLSQATTLLLTPVALACALLVRVPTAVALVTLLPTTIAAFGLAVQMIGLVELAEVHGLRRPWKQVLALPFVWLPYNWVLGYAAARAVVRQVLGATNWEKTPHTGAHRVAPEWAPSADEVREHVGRWTLGLPAVALAPGRAGATTGTAHAAAGETAEGGGGGTSSGVAAGARDA
ncbi:MAG TPA: glycosyltransferase [Candidatus Dormibacteraeota bacterium]|jgi:cellulose synthase/poly-beta-1,6-N-acetylglucosamine synthase-like glycosyltransferase|nr:glycosyltransferase [Candidatus Dormibacteraeota bacterium]